MAVVIWSHDYVSHAENKMFAFILCFDNASPKIKKKMISKI